MPQPTADDGRPSPTSVTLRANAGYSPERGLLQQVGITEVPMSAHTQRRANDGSSQEQRQESAPQQEQQQSNSQAMESMGVEGSGAGGGAFGPVAELDPGLAQELDGLTTVASMVLDDRAPLLVGLEAEADVQGTYDVLDFIGQAVGDLEDALDACDEEAQDQCLVDLAIYGANLVDATNLVEAEGDTQKCLEDYMVEQGIAAAAALATGMAGLESVSVELSDSEQAMASYMALMEEAQEELRGHAASALVDSIVDAFKEMLLVANGGGQVIATAVSIGVDAASALTADMMKKAFSTGGDGFSALNEAVVVGTSLRDSAVDTALRLAEMDAVADMVGQLGGLVGQLETVDEVTGAVESFALAAEGLLEEGHHLLAGPIPRANAVLGADAKTTLEEISVYLVENGARVRDTCAAHYEEAQAIRTRNPGRYDPL